jgi:2-polyprenyl-6-methoxyphenol hydroxylase-like FAD-dependent oxidoreductase
MRRNCARLSREALQVGIVGLGTAGTAAGILLARQGHHVKIYEKTSSSAAQGYVGAGIGMQPIGLTVLRRLGQNTLNSVLDHGHRIDRLYGEDTKGKTILDLSYSDLDENLFGVGLHRGVLFHELIQAAQNFPALEICYGATVTHARVEGTETELIKRIDNNHNNTGSYLVSGRMTA